MSTYVIKTVQEFDELTAADLIPFVDGCGRLDVRIEGAAVSRPFAVLNVLRSAGFLHTHTWVEHEEQAERSPASLRVTAVRGDRSFPRDCDPRLSLVALA